MVTRVLSNTDNGDLLVDPTGGVEADVISVAAGELFNDFVIKTYGANDKVTLTAADPLSRFQIFAGAGTDSVTSGASGDTVFDGSGNDKYSLGAGIDIVSVGSGNDTYDGGSGTTDSINFLFAPSEDGTGSVFTSRVTVDLALKTRQDFGIAFGKDLVLNFENVVTGNGSDVIKGTNGANQIESNGNKDYVDGRGGNDTIIGGDGQDYLTGGSGADQIQLNESTAARDSVRFSKTSDSPLKTGTSNVYTNYDQIKFFDAGKEATADRIDLSKFSGSFKFVSKIGTTSAHEVWIETRNVDGDAKLDTVVHIDTDSDRFDEMRIYVMDVSGLTKGDFLP